MSSSKINIPSLCIKNGFRLLPLLLLIIFSLFFHSCATTKYNVQKEEISPKNSSDRISQKRQEIIQLARTYIGVPYKYAGKNPAGFDCSGFTYYVSKQNGIKLYGSSELQANNGRATPLDRLQPGDLVFFGSGGKITHVGFVTRQDQEGLMMIHSSSSRGIVEESVTKSEYWSKRLKFGRNLLN